MSGNFDAIVAQTLASMGGSPDRAQEARDLIARQMNMAQRGVNSTAYPAPQQQVAQPVQAQQLPAPSSPQQPNMNDAIAAQLGDNVPVPTARPTAVAAPLPQQMGDASVMEAMATQAPQQSPIDSAIAQTVGEPTLAPTPASVAAPATAPVPGADATGDTQNGNNILAFLAAAGGVGGAGVLYQRYLAGDQDAAKTFQAFGMDPNDFAMFADEPLNQRSGRLQYTDASEEGNQSNTAKSSDGTEGAKKQAAPRTRQATSQAPNSVEKLDGPGGARLNAPLADWLLRMNATIPKVKVPAR